MKIASPDLALIARATAGNLAAVDALLLQIQPGIFNLALRMLGNRDDAADATQEILLKVVTHLSGFRAEAAFSTWVFQVARNHLLTAATRTRESPEVSLDAMAERLQQGLDYAAGMNVDAGQSLTPEDKLEARQIALACTQNMLMALERNQRLAYILDTVFGLSSAEAGEVLGISAETYRQRLARARAQLNAFAGKSCGLVSEQAACRCERQLPAARQRQAPEKQAGSVIAIHVVERQEAERHFESLLRLGDAAALFRAHPEYRAPQHLRAAIRTVLGNEGLLGSDTSRS